MSNGMKECGFTAADFEAAEKEKKIKVYILQRGVQWKQGVVVYILL